jgi:hypothetical protein
MGWRLPGSLISTRRHLTIQTSPYFRLAFPLLYSQGDLYRSRERGADVFFYPARDCTQAPADTYCRRQCVGSNGDG